MRSRLIVLVLLFYSVSAWSLPGGILVSSGSPIRLFQSEEILNIEIISDFPRVAQIPKIPDVQNEPKFKGSLNYSELGKPGVKFSVKVSPRGEDRRDECSGFQPLKIEFDKNQNLVGTIFEGSADDIKLVTHCEGLGKVEDDSSQVQKVLKEYTAYKIIEALGVPSFKTRLLRISYKHHNGSLIAQAIGFFIEPKKNMAARMNLLHVKSENAEAAHKTADHKVIIPASLANEAIANFDFGPEVGHNLVYLKNRETTSIVSAATYDFDIAGAVYRAGPISAEDKYWIRYRINMLRSEGSSELRIGDPVAWKKSFDEVAEYFHSKREAAFSALAKSPASNTQFMHDVLVQFFESLRK